jgi:hypothetical protein
MLFIGEVTAIKASYNTTINSNKNDELRVVFPTEADRVKDSERKKRD